MSAREWLPERYFDEVIPALRASPTAWIVKDAAGAPTLADFHGDAGSALADGDIVPFMFHVDHGTGTLTIAEDLTWTATPPMPAEANGVWSPELSDVGGSCSIASLVKDVAEFGSLEPGESRLCFSYWSDPLPYRFDAASGTFVQVAS